MIIKKLRFQNGLHTRRKTGIFKFSLFEERFLKASFSLWIMLVWNGRSLGLIMEIELRFQKPPE